MSAQDVVRGNDSQVDKAFRQMQVAQNPNNQEARGPLAALEKNRFSTNDVRYPLDIGTNEHENLHYIVFRVNVQDKSQYNKSERTAIGPTVNTNRARDAASDLKIGQVSSNIDSVQAGLGEVASGAIFGAAIGGGVGQIAGAIGGPAVGVAGAAIGATVGAALGSTIVNSIDLTRKTKRIKSTISMYMPDSIFEKIGHGYNKVSMTDALGVVGAIGQGTSGVGTSIESYFQQTFGSGALPDLTAAGSGSLSELVGTIAEASGAFGGGIKEAILFSAGLARNPQIEVLYTETAHREFQFDFRMAPRTRAEAEAIRKIIKEFKFHSAPELLGGSQGRFFIPPAEFDIEFMYNGKPNPNINKISSCVLTNIDINYAGTGQWTTFADGMPVEIQMQLRFQELELIHKQRVAEGY